MKSKHGIWLLCLIVGALFLPSAVVSAGVASEPYVSYDQWYDAAGAPDIREVTLTDSWGVVDLTVVATNMQVAEQGPVATTVVDTMIDVDRSAATGDELGSDYALEVGYDADGLYAGFWQYADDGWVEMTPSESMAFTSAGNAYTFTFATADLGGTTGFDYYVATGAWTADDELVGSDLAPDEGALSYWPVTTGSWNGGGAIASLPDGTLYLGGDDSLWHKVDAATLNALGYADTPITQYGALPGQLGAPIEPIAVATPAPTPTPVTQVVAAVVKPVIAKPTTTPAKPVAGKTFTVKFNVTRSDTGAKLLLGKMICDPSVKGKVIKHFEQFKDGVATMRFTIPTSAKGKVLKVHLTIEAGTEFATRNLGFRVL